MMNRTLDQLITSAAQGLLSKSDLAAQLDAGHRAPFLDACAAIERAYTERCTATTPCLRDGCAVEGEICLQPLVKAGLEYHRACAGEWIKVFVEPRNRIEVWKH